MKITIKQLEEFGACSDGIKWVKEQKCFDLEKLIEKAIKTKKIKILEYANWGITRFMNNEDRIRYAIYAAEQVIDIFEKGYPKDDRPRKAIEAAKGYLKNPNEITNNAAANAVYAAAAANAVYADAAAYAAAYAAAANAAYDAYDAAANAVYADAAAYAAAYAYAAAANAAYAAAANAVYADAAANAAYDAAANAAYDAADAAAYDAAYAAAADADAAAYAAYANTRVKMLIKILKYGVTLIKKL